jgi:hypothetical protein
MEVCKLADRPRTGEMADLRAASLETLLQLVGAGFGCTLVPALAIRGGWMTDSGIIARRWPVGREAPHLADLPAQLPAPGGAGDLRRGHAEPAAEYGQGGQRVSAVWPTTPPGQRTFFASAARNLETLLAEELRASASTASAETRAGVRFTGTLEEAYRALIWSRVASRVLLPLAEFDAPDADTLYDASAASTGPAPRRRVEQAMTLAVHLDSVRSGIAHGHFGALRIKDAIVDQFRDLGLERPSWTPGVRTSRLRCQLFRDRATLSLDLAGDPLHRRGWRVQEVAAPLKENLAAAVLLRAGWPERAARGAPLLDPMCGSGTLPIEAALMAADIAPGLLRASSASIGAAPAGRNTTTSSGGAAGRGARATGRRAGPVA